MIFGGVILSALCTIAYCLIIAAHTSNSTVDSTWRSRSRQINSSFWVCGLYLFRPWLNVVDCLHRNVFHPLSPLSENGTAFIHC